MFENHVIQITEDDVIFINDINGKRVSESKSEIVAFPNLFN